MKKIFLENLMVMQDDLRHPAQIPEMIEFVRQGGFWTQDVLANYAKNNQLTRICPLKEIIEFPDKKYMTHDGHHRLVSVYLGGRDYIREDEFVIKNWTYDDYLEINFPNNWVTPFDPRTEIRLAEIGKFKKHALDLSKKSPEEAMNFIASNKSSYAKERNVFTIKCLADLYLKEIQYKDKNFCNGIESEYFRKH